MIKIEILLLLGPFKQLVADVFGSRIADIAGTAVGTVILGLLAALGFTGFLVVSVQRSWHRRRLKPLPAHTFNVLIADLHNDDTGRNADRIRHSLEAQYGAAKRDAPVRVARCHDLLDIADAEAARKRGLRHLQRLNGTVLVWGEADDDVLRLRFLSYEEEGAASTSYKLNDVKELPTNFGEALGAVLMAEIAASVKSGYDTGNFVAGVLRPAVDRLRRFVESMPAALTPAQRAALLLSLADASQILGWQSGTAEDLQRAIAAYRAALQEYTRERVPLDWAMTQNNLGNALETLGERGDDKALADAVTAYREALQERTRARVPLDWAMTQNNLGAALQTLGERGDSAALGDAIMAYREALAVFEKLQNASHYVSVSQRHLARAEALLLDREAAGA